MSYRIFYIRSVMRVVGYFALAWRVSVGVGILVGVRNPRDRRGWTIRLLELARDDDPVAPLGLGTVQGGVSGA